MIDIGAIELEVILRVWSQCWRIGEALYKLAKSPRSQKQTEKPKKEAPEAHASEAS